MNYLKIEILDLELEFIVGQDAYDSMREAKQVQQEFAEEGDIVEIETIEPCLLIAFVGVDSIGNGGFVSKKQRFDSRAEAEQHIARIYGFDGEGVHGYESNE